METGSHPWQCLVLSAYFRISMYVKNITKLPPPLLLLLYLSNPIKIIPIEFHGVFATFILYFFLFPPALFRIKATTRLVAN